MEVDEKPKGILATIVGTFLEGHLSVLLAALALAFGTTTVGLMASFALVLIPPWIAFRFAGSWRGTLLLSVGLGTLAYLLAFAMALGLDQPFGPVLVALLLALAIAARVVGAAILSLRQGR